MTTPPSTDHDPKAPEQKRPPSRAVLGIRFLLIAPVAYLGFQLFSGARGIPELIGSPTPLSLAAVAVCILASLAAFGGKKFRLK